MTTRICKVCGETKAFKRGTWVWKSSTGKCEGLTCLACNNKRKVWTPELRAKSRAKSKVWRELNVVKAKELTKAWCESNKVYRATYMKAWYAARPGRATSDALKRRLLKNKRVPKWVDADELFLINECYALAKLRSKVTGIQWHVDHEIPLRGAKVSGLHVFENLQIIPASVNLAKYNRYAV